MLIKGDILFLERSETPVCCSVPKNYDRCLGRETLLLSEVPVQCSAKSACPNGYVCSNHTTNMQFMCCKQYDPLKQICPENRLAFSLRFYLIYILK